jgi:hypothetical protein
METSHFTKIPNEQHSIKSYCITVRESKVIWGDIILYFLLLSNTQLTKYIFSVHSYCIFVKKNTNWLGLKGEFFGLMYWHYVICLWVYWFKKHLIFNSLFARVRNIYCIMLKTRREVLGLMEMYLAWCDLFTGWPWGTGLTLDFQFYFCSSKKYIMLKTRWEVLGLMEMYLAWCDLFTGWPWGTGYLLIFNFLFTRVRNI